MFIGEEKGNIAGFVSLAKRGKMKQCCKMTLGQLQLKYGTFFFNVSLLAVKKKRKRRTQWNLCLGIFI